jgi:hypothetical protein
MRLFRLKQPSQTSDATLETPAPQKQECMKTSTHTFTFLVLIFALCALPLAAQTTTNIQVTVKVTVTQAGVSTNIASSVLNLDPVTPKDLLRINGASFSYYQARANGFTNTLDFFLAKQEFSDVLKADSDALNRANNTVTLGKITTLLTTQLDLLSASDLSSLTTIAAKAQ